MKTDSFTFPDVAWQAVKRRGAPKAKGLALREAEGPLTEGEEPDFFKIMARVKNPATLPRNFIISVDQNWIFCQHWPEFVPSLIVTDKNVTYWAIKDGQLIVSIKYVGSKEFSAG